MIRMKAEQAYTPYSRQNYSCEMQNKRQLNKKQVFDARYIQDRYLNRLSPKNLSQNSTSNQELNPQSDLSLKNSYFGSLFPKIDVKLSLRENKRQFTRGATPNLKLNQLHVKNKPIESFSTLNCQIRQKNDCIFATHEGGRIKNQDRISIEEFQVFGKSYRYYAVFDGHGGHLAATYMANQLHHLVKSALNQGLDPLSSLKQALSVIEQKFKKNARLAHKSGSCALVCLLSDKQYWVANVGDSRMLSITKDNQIAQITRDHKPEDQNQRRRIQYNGGEVSRNNRTEVNLSSQELPFRVYPGSLSVSRTIGDINLKKRNPNLVIALPDIYNFKLDKEKYLLIFSDGLYEKLSNRQICQFFLPPKTKVKTAISQLYKQASNRQSTDNRSLVVLQIK